MQKTGECGIFRFESDADYLKNKSLLSVDLAEQEGAEHAEIDLAKYYGLKGVPDADMNVDHVDESKFCVVYELKHPTSEHT